MTIIGVDLGDKGGWVALENGKVVATDAKSADKADALVEYLGTVRDYFNIFVELPLANRQGTSIRALTRMHYAHGYFSGVMDQAGQCPTEITYHEWARVMLNGGKYPASVRCRELWPDSPEIAAHEGLADAALIAEYGRKLIQKGQK